MQSSTDKFDEIVSKALALEAAKMDRELARATTNCSKGTPDINKVFGNKKPPKPFNKSQRKIKL